jgi:hypothetical protein
MGLPGFGNVGEGGPPAHAPRLELGAKRWSIPDAMRTRKQDIERRTVIEAYAKYDCSKKNRSIPPFATWDWSQADTIDREMKCARLKTGVPAGYLVWDEIEVTMSDLRECAVDVNIFPSQSRKLGLIGAEELVTWKLNCHNAWYDGIAGGRTLDETAPMLLRPAVRGEFPATWYIEDGSGRAIAFVANQHIFNSSQTLATGYLGRNPDTKSAFMREKFPELFCR